MTTKTEASKPARRASIKPAEVFPAYEERLAKSKKPASRAAMAVVVSVTAFKESYGFDPRQRIELIRSGVSATRVNDMADYLGRPRGYLLDILRIPPSTAGRKIEKSEPLAPDQTERILGLESLIGQVQTMVEESGNPEGFDAARWVADWIDRPLTALGGEKPADYMDTREGQLLVSRLLSQMQSGAYA